MTKHLEARSGLKVAVIGTAAQLVQLKEADGDSERSPEDSEASDSDPCSVHYQLRQIELGWSGLLADVPVVQQALHKVSGLPVKWSCYNAGSQTSSLTSTDVFLKSQSFTWILSSMPTCTVRSSLVFQKPASVSVISFKHPHCAAQSRQEDSSL